MSETLDQRALNRRRALFGGAAVVAGAGAAAVIGGTSAHAATGDPVIAGQAVAASSTNETWIVNNNGKAMFGTPDGAVVGVTLASTANMAGVAGQATNVGQVGVAAKHTAANGAPLYIAPKTARPAGGAHLQGEVVSVNGALHVCVASGTPGTWANVGFNPINPARIMDTREGIAKTGKLLGGDANAFALSVAGVSGIPSAAKAVAYNLTVAGPTVGGWLTVWPDGTAKPGASNINFSAGQTIANFATTKLGSNGKVKIALSSGASHVIVDVAGYYI